MEPGVYDGIPADDYHRDPDSISSTGLRQILPPGCPAAYRYGQSEHSEVLDFGRLAHRLVLGDGDKFVIAPYDAFRTNEAKEWKAEQEAAGMTVIAAIAHREAQDMAAAVQAHPWAGLLFTEGKPEQSLYWIDPETGVSCRARFDWLRDVQAERRLLIPDYKTARSANPAQFAKSAASYGYAQQAAFYMDGAIALGLDRDPAFVFVVQEKVRPYLVTVIELHPDDIEHARELNRRALRIYADCLERDQWPGHAESVVTVELPPWHRYQTEEFLAS